MSGKLHFTISFYIPITDEDLEDYEVGTLQDAAKVHESGLAEGEFDILDSMGAGEDYTVTVEALPDDE